jgi:hypothetical protein
VPNKSLKKYEERKAKLISSQEEVKDDSAVFLLLPIMQGSYPTALNASLYLSDNRPVKPNCMHILYGIKKKKKQNKKQEIVLADGTYNQCIY